MKRPIAFLSILLTLSLVLAACSSQNASSTSTAYPAPTESGLATQAAGSSQVTLPAPETPASQPSATGAGSAAGAVDPGLLTNLQKMQVSDSSGAQIGSISDLVLSFDDQKLIYVIVNLSSLAGSGSSSGSGIAVPWSEFTVNASGTPPSLTVNVSTDVLSKAPVFDPASVPGIGQPASGWDSQIQSYWQSQAAGGASTPSEANTTPGAAGTSAATPMGSVVTGTPAIASTSVANSTAGSQSAVELNGVVLASKLLNVSVKSSDGQDVGVIQDGVTDVQTGALSYVVLSPSVGGSLVPVPLQVFGWDDQNQAFVLMVDQATVNGAPNFSIGQVPNTQQSGWDANIQSYWSQHMPSGS